MLERDLTNKTYGDSYDWPNRTVLTGVLVSPYSGDTINFTRGAGTVDAVSNQSKSGNLPDEWMLEQTAFHCEYATMTITMLAEYDLPIPAATAETLNTALDYS